jgi:alkylation response protein AidB-like acyl-CoA dehydrogenase
VTTAPADLEELRQLRDAVRGVIAPLSDDAVGAPGWRAGWEAVAELGVTALCVPETEGGYGLAVEAAVTVAAEFGAALHGCPYAGLVASAQAAATVADPAARRIVGEVVEGRRVVAFGVLDADSTDLDGVVRGTARRVDGAPVADAFLFAIRGSRDLLLVSDANVCRVDPAGTFDTTRACGDVVLDGVSYLRITSDNVAPDLFRLLLAADALGIVQHMLDRTVAYASERFAFGRPIGGFQAVQHRLVDHTVRVRGMRLVVTEAARAIATNAMNAPRAVTLAELTVSNSAVHVLHDLLQLTGAIGFTWEYGLHLYERRAHQDARLVGNPRAAIRALAAAEGWAR